MQASVIRTSQKSRLLLFNKPFGVLAQFTDQDGRQTLKDFINIPGIYPVGRLDRDSEGLLLLTNNGQLQNMIASPKHKMPKTYWVQVEGIPTTQALDHLSCGLVLNDGPTLPAKTELIDSPEVWERVPPIRVRKSVPDSWLELTIREGRNRQVRRMTAAIGHPTLRLIRCQVGPWTIDALQPGHWRELEIPTALKDKLIKNTPKSMKWKTSKKHPRWKR